MHRFPLYLCIVLVILSIAACKIEPFSTAVPNKSLEWPAFAHPELVTIRGYEGDAMEPFITRDGRYLLFNNSNTPSVDTDLLYAERIDDLTFEYKGEIRGVNSASLDAVPSMDLNLTFYFVSTRSYADTYSTIFSGKFDNGSVSNVGLVPRISRNEKGIIHFDAEISPDGLTLYFVDGRFGGEAIPETADLVIAEWDGIGFTRLSNSEAILEKINSSALEYAPTIAVDGLELIFTRFDITHPSQEPEIFQTRRSTPEEPFEIPTCITSISGFVEAPSLSLDGSSLYYHKKENGHYVIYRVSR